LIGQPTPDNGICPQVELLFWVDGPMREAGHTDFDAYSQEQWGKTKTITELGTMVPTGQLPETEQQARELARLDPERRVDVWQSTVQTYGVQPTAAQIRQTAAPPMLAIVDLETGEVVDDDDLANKPASPLTIWPIGCMLRTHESLESFRSCACVRENGNARRSWTHDVRLGYDVGDPVARISRAGQCASRLQSGVFAGRGGQLCAGLRAGRRAQLR
jgi:hypothetical protein